jgi:hypothetical protein
VEAYKRREIKAQRAAPWEWPRINSFSRTYTRPSFPYSEPFHQRLGLFLTAPIFPVPTFLKAQSHSSIVASKKEERRCTMTNQSIPKTRYCARCKTDISEIDFWVFYGVPLCRDCSFIRRYIGARRNLTCTPFVFWFVATTAFSLMDLGSIQLDLENFAE